MKSTIVLFVLGVLLSAAVAHKRPRDAFCGHDTMIHEHLRDQNALHLLKAPFKAAAGASTCNTEGRCDDPSVRDAWQVRQLTVRVAFYVFCDNAGVCPDGVDTGKIKDQLLQLQTDYTPYNISIMLSTLMFINDTSCSVPQGSNRSLWRLAVGACKAKYFQSPESQINIMVSNYQTSNPFEGTLLGFGTFPWSKRQGLDPLGTIGGVWLNSRYTGLKERTLTHELAHNFGLHHPFVFFQNDVSQEVCLEGDGLECYEFVHAPDDYNANYVGDFCADTPATDVNYQCADPSGGDCLGTPFGKTDFDNYMAYADDSCIDHFTPQQVKRMQCWICDSIKSQTAGGC